MDPLSLDDPVYADLSQLAATGLAPLWATTVRPLTRMEVAGILGRSLDRLASHRAERFSEGVALLERLVLRFADELSLLGYQIVAPARPPSAASLSGWGGLIERAFTWRISLGLAPWFQSDPGSSAGTRLMAGAGAGPRLAFGVELQSRLTPPPLAVTIERLFISGDSGEWGRAQMALDRLWWGPGGSGAWLLSDWPGALESVRWSLEWDRVRATKLFGRIDQPSGRNVYGFRLDWLATDNLRIGLGESVIASGGFLIPYALSPIPLFTYGLANSRRQAGLPDNYNLALDFDWRVRTGAVVYGELFIDDLATSPDPYPSRGGATLGIFLSNPFRTERTTLRFEHARSTNWTYSAPGNANEYARGNKTLGHWCAPDCEMWSAEVSHRASQNGLFRLAWNFVRKGEGGVGQPWPAASQAWANFYLSGIVEQTQSWRLSYIWAREDQTRYEVGVARSSLANAGHVPGASRQDWFFWWEARHRF